MIWKVWKKQQTGKYFYKKYDYNSFSLKLSADVEEDEKKDKPKNKIYITLKPDAKKQREMFCNAVTELLWKVRFAPSCSSVHKA